MKKNNKGFTLIELLVVIAIIGLLSTLAVVSLNSARMKARDARRQSDLKQISTAMELYRSNTESYPGIGTCNTAGMIAATTGGDLCGAATPSRIFEGTNVYLQQMPVNPSYAAAGSNYRYVSATPATTYCISATLEAPASAAVDNFVCVNGSCYLAADPC